MAVDNIYRVTTSQAAEMIKRVLDAGLVPYITGSPGVGKSSIVKAISESAQLHTIDHRLSTMPPEDLTGIPVPNGDHADYLAFENIFPTNDQKIPEGKNGWLLLLDEFPHASYETLKASHKLLLDREVGQKKLHDAVYLVLTGNLDSDKAMTNRLSTAIRSRIVHIEVRSDFETWLTEVAIPQKYDSRIIAYLSNNKTQLNDFNPDSSEKTFCCERTWEFVNKLIQNRKELDNLDLFTLAGTITSGVAVSFKNFTEIFSNLLSIDEVVNYPETAQIPTTPNETWATVSMLIDNTNYDNFEKVIIYVKRFSLEFRIIYFRYLLLGSSDYKKHPVFPQAMQDLMKYLNS